MREIKFRAWSFTSKTMIHEVMAGNTITDSPCSSVYSNGKRTNFDRYCGVIMQYTGLKDKHGKEIYEGDILEGDVRYYGLDNLGKHSEKQLFVVERDIMKSGFFLTRIHLYPRNQRSNIKGDFINGPTKKIMGNIYENSELLK